MTHAVYDNNAVNLVVAMERALRGVPRNHQGRFQAVLNAIEMMVEVSPADLTVVRYLGLALLALAQSYPLDVPARQLLAEKRLRRLSEVTGKLTGPVIPDEALRREGMYEERV